MVKIIYNKWYKPFVIKIIYLVDFYPFGKFVLQHDLEWHNNDKFIYISIKYSANIILSFNLTLNNRTKGYQHNHISKKQIEKIFCYKGFLKILHLKCPCRIFMQNFIFCLTCPVQQIYSQLQCFSPSY